ncbi:MAG: tetratricopeptide repeat protein [Chloroflexi bacterium]|nr:tetratricopeptide repeat protein [Chloroflexota bacterium]
MCQDQLRPDHVEALTMWQRGFRRQMTGDLDGAEQLYRSSIERHPTGEAWTFLGWVASFRGDLDRAIECCKQAIGVDPDYGNPYNDIGAYMIERGECEAAISWLERATRASRYESPAYPWTNLGRAFERLGRVADAVAHYRRALELEPRYAAATDALERLLARRNGHPKL